MMYAELIGNYESYRIKSRSGNRLEITHTVDGIRYFCVSRVLAAEAKAQTAGEWPDEDEEQESYDSYMTGGEITAGYLLG